MLLNRLHINIIVRTIGILLNCIVIATILVSMNDIIILINIATLLVIQVVLLIRYLNHTNRDLETFFNSIRNNDPNLKFENSENSSQHSKLYDQFNRINENIRSIKIENENSNQYFKILVEHIGIGVISFTENGEVTLFNRAAKEIFKRHHLFRIKDLDTILDGLSTLLISLKTGDQKLISLHHKSETIQLSVKVTEFSLMDETVKLVSFQNIKNELDSKEFDSWQKLIRVLTHEIMNSVAPINSTIETLLEILTMERSESENLINSELIDDTIEGLQIVDERSKGMINFVTGFRNLTLLPKPVFKTINIYELISNTVKLLSKKLESNNIETIINIPNRNATIEGDKSMIEQVLINLIKNAIEALEVVDKKRLTISTTKNIINNSLTIEIKDNGCGISQEIIDEIFVPFFTTKDDGSGVGLSLSRQFMRLHGGRLDVFSEEKLGTSLKMAFINA